MTIPRKLSFLLVVLIGLTACNNVGPRSVRAEPTRDVPVNAGTPAESPRGLPRHPRNAADELTTLESPRIVVRKSERKLLLFSGNKLVRTYRIGLGLSPVGDKVRQGDRRTPEGDFYVFTKNDKSAFYLSLGV